MTEQKKRYTPEEAKAIGDVLGIDWKSFKPEEFCRGLDVEFEHGSVDMRTNVTGDDPILVGKIVLAHLQKYPDYYSRLFTMEVEAATFWEMQGKRKTKLPKQKK